MKKLIVIVAIAAAVVSAKAATVDWAVSASSTDVGYSVYLLTSIADSYADVDALAAAAVGSAEIKSLGRGKYGASATSTSAAITSTSMKDAYFAIVTSADATSFKYVSVGDLSGLVYDAGNQETSPGKYNTLSTATILAGTSKDFGGSTPPGPGPSPIPEPTSGLLMLLGAAGLALRRRA